MDRFFPEFLFWCQVHLREFDGVLWSLFSLFTRIKILRYTTQLYRPLQHSNRSFRTHLSSTFCWAFPPPQHVKRNMFFHICIQSQTCSFDTREDANSYMTGFSNFCNGTEFRSSSLTTVQVSLYQSDMTETTWVSCWTLSMCLPLKTLSPFPLNVGVLSFLTLGDCSPFHNIVLDSEVSSSHHLINMKFYSCLLLLIVRLHASRRFLIHTKPSQSEVGTEFSNFDLYNSSRIISDTHR